MGPALMDDAWIYGGRLDQIYNSIYQGRPNGMPAWGGKIPRRADLADRRLCALDVAAGDTGGATATARRRSIRRPCRARPTCTAAGRCPEGTVGRHPLMRCPLAIAALLAAASCHAPTAGATDRRLRLERGRECRPRGRRRDRRGSRATLHTGLRPRGMAALARRPNALCRGEQFATGSKPGTCSRAAASGISIPAPIPSASRSAPTARTLYIANEDHSAVSFLDIATGQITARGAGRA